jgi:hypothetical protein
MNSPDSKPSIEHTLYGIRLISLNETKRWLLDAWTYYAMLKQLFEKVPDKQDRPKMDSQ